MNSMASTWAAAVCIALLQSSIVNATDGIRALVHPNGTIEVTHAMQTQTPERPAPGVFLVECEKLQLALAPAKNTTDETAVFEGNVTVRGERFKARAGKATLNEKGLLRLESDGAKDAVLSFRKSDGAAPATLKFSRIDYWPKEGKFKVNAVRPPVSRVPADRNSSGGASP